MNKLLCLLALMCAGCIESGVIPPGPAPNPVPPAPSPVDPVTPDRPTVPADIQAEISRALAGRKMDAMRYYGLFTAAGHRVADASQYPTGASFAATVSKASSNLGIPGVKSDVLDKVLGPAIPLGAMTDSQRKTASEALLMLGEACRKAAK